MTRFEAGPSERCGHAAPRPECLPVARSGSPAIDWHPQSFPACVFSGKASRPSLCDGKDATHAPSAAQREIVSSAMPFVRGPISPIAAITITIAPAMNANTPTVPNPLSTAAITNDEKIAEKRLHE